MQNSHLNGKGKQLIILLLPPISFGSTPRENDLLSSEEILSFKSRPLFGKTYPPGNPFENMAEKDRGVPIHHKSVTDLT